MDLSAADVIRLLGLRPHPEGGHFHEIFRDARNVQDQRAASTAIYYLLARGERAHWHRVDAAEVWHFYGGDSLSLQISENGRTREEVLGMDLAAGARPQIVVPAGAWQSAQSLGDWTLAGCTVAPGFEFACFEMAPKGWAP
jgi:predicted cupin superfamily sugar epimerase